METTNKNPNIIDFQPEQIGPQLSGQESIFPVKPQVSSTDYMYRDLKGKANDKLSYLEEKNMQDSEEDFFSSAFRQAAPAKKLSFEGNRISLDEAYTPLSDGTFTTRYDQGFIKGDDNEQAYAQRQSTGEKWINGLTKFVGKTGVNVIGGTLGTAWGAIEAVGTGNWKAVYDNSFYDMLDDMNTNMDNSLANYRTQEEMNNGFGSSMLTANFWADDFLGGMSFMAGTIISEGLWATATGGASLATTGARVGLRAGQLFKTTAALAKGTKTASKVYSKYARQLASLNKATNYGKAGAAANIVRFTYTGAGFEAGMEARLFQKEQKENFYGNFETLNGRKLEAGDISDFENNLSSATNAVWATNMALVGTSNLAILGKTFGIKSPFKLPKNQLSKFIYGGGTKTTLGKGGQATATVAIEKNAFQRGLGLTTGLLKNPIYEGIVEEGGQAVTTTAAESWIDSRYNVNRESAEVVEAMYEGFSHTYGTKEGWKEVGLGMLIGFIGGEAVNVSSRQGFLSEARDGVSKTNSKDDFKAKLMTESRGEVTADRLFAQGLEEKFQNASEIIALEKQLERQLAEGDLMGVSNTEKTILLQPLKAAVQGDFLEEQLDDFRTALEFKKDDLAKRYGIELKENSEGEIDYTEVNTQIDSLIEDSKDLADMYKKSKDFADYIFADGTKELGEDGKPIPVESYRVALATQMTMTGVMEGNMTDAHSALKTAVGELSPKVRTKITKALNRHKKLKMSNQKVVKSIKTKEAQASKVDGQIKKLRKELDALDIQNKGDQTTEAKQSQSNKVNKILEKIGTLEESLQALNLERSDLESKLAKSTEENTAQQQAAKALSSITDDNGDLSLSDPLEGEEVSSITLDETVDGLESLEEILDSIKDSDPELHSKIKSLAFEYKKGLTYWKRNSEVLADLTNPETGLKRMKGLFSRSKKANQTTLEMLQKLDRSIADEVMINSTLSGLTDIGREEEEEVEEVDQKQPEKPENENKKEEEAPGEAPTEVTMEEELQAVDDQYDEEVEAARQKPDTENISEELTKKKYDIFVDSGIVSEGVLINIAAKIKNNEALTKQEQAVLNSKTAEINQILVDIKSVSIEDDINQERQRAQEIENELEQEFNSLQDEASDESAPDFTNDQGGIFKALDYDGDLSNKKTIVKAFQQIGKVSKKQSDFFGKERIEKIKKLTAEWKKLASALSPGKIKNRRADAAAKVEQAKVNKQKQQLSQRQEEIEKINEEREKAKRNVRSRYQRDSLQDKINSLKELLTAIINTSRIAIANYSQETSSIIDGVKPTSEEVDAYIQMIEDKDTQSEEFLALAAKMSDWRIIANTNLDGSSVKDILDELAAYEMELGTNELQMTTEQTLEIVEKAAKKYAMEQSDPDYVQTMSKVNVKRTETELQVSHLKVKTLEDKGFTVEETGRVNRGDTKNPKMGTKYKITKGDFTATIIREDKGHRIIVPSGKVEGFLGGMEMALYDSTRKQWSGWGFAFQLGEDGYYRPMESDMDITVLDDNGQAVSVLNPKSLYNLKKGEKVFYQVNMKEDYNANEVEQMISEDRMEEARNMFAIQLVNKNGEVLGYLKAGYAGQINNNASKLRDRAFEMFMEKRQETNTLSGTVLKLPFESKVESVNIGLPNIELTTQGTPRSFSITEKQSSLVAGYGFSKNGTTTYAGNSDQKDDKGVNKIFLPKDRSSAFVVVKWGNNKIAFPVALNETDTDMTTKVNAVLNSNEESSIKKTRLISLLRSNGVETASMDLDGVIQNGIASSPELAGTVTSMKRTFSEEEIRVADKMDFVSNVSIALNLDKDPFVSPKFKMDLSKNYNETDGGESAAYNAVKEKWTASGQTKEDWDSMTEEDRINAINCL